MSDGSAQAASTAAPPHRPCVALEDGAAGLADDVVHRFLLGQDAAPVPLSAAEADQQLGDPFAQLVLLQGTFPPTAGAVLDAIEDAVPAGDPLRTQQFFLVGEGSQISSRAGLRVRRNLRFLATCGRGPGGPDVTVSAFHPDQGTAEVMAWDRRSGGFNYYRTVGESSAWVFAGNSRHALAGPVRGNGPFESHKAGHFLMKELRFPWVHWDSPAARVALSVLAEEGLFGHPWVERLTPGGAYTLEEFVAIPSIQRWTAARLSALVDGRSEETPRRIIEQIVGTPTVNLMSSTTSSAAAATGGVPTVDLPDSFFVDAAGLDVVGLDPPPRIFVPSAVYTNTLRTFDVRLSDGAGLDRPGDTHFAFVVPERAFEDTDTMRQAIDAGVISRRLAACLLMVDFPNPVFSERRGSLLRHVPDSPFSTGRDLSQELADAIQASDEASQRGTAEHEFAQRWNVGEAFEGPFNALLQSYYDAVERRSATQEGFDDYWRLAESRRDKVREMPIAESPLLFARTNIPPGTRTMQPDGSVEEG